MIDLNYPHYLIELLRAAIVCALIGMVAGLIVYFAVTRER